MNMKTRNIFGLLMTAFVLGVSSCDYTDLDPSDMVGKGEAFKNVAGVRSAVVGNYSQLSLRPSLSLSAIISDDVVKGGQNGGAGDDSYKWTYSAGTGDHNGFWEDRYKIINQANRILMYGKDVTPEDDSEKETLNDCFGQAYFLRAYAHFDLLRMFSDFKDENAYGIPYITKAHILGLPGRDKVGACYDYIMKDLDQAFALLKDEVSSEAAYASKAAVYALKARVCLYRQKYVHAAVYAGEALQLVPLASITDYASIWSDKSNAGVILKLPKKPGESALGTMFNSADHSQAFGPSKGYMNNFDKTNDIRYSIFVGYGPDREGVMVDLIKKYFGTDANAGLCDEKILRADEMKLIEIESYIKQGRWDEANESLNDFRRLRINNWTTHNYSNAELPDELLKERRRELGYEGHRFFDLRRYNMPIVRDDGSTLQADHFRMIMPIPQAEIEANVNIAKEQNPGY